MKKAGIIASGSRVHRPLLDGTLTKEDLYVAKNELNETPEIREAALEILRKRLGEQNEIVCRNDDAYLLRFLRCRKFDCDRAFKTMQDHFKFRKKHPDVFPSPSGVEEALRLCIFNFLPHRDHKGRAVYVVLADRWDLKRISYADFVAAGNLVAEYVLENSVTQINGYIGIWDFKGFSFNHFTTFCFPKHIVLLATLMQDRFPGRFKIAYCVNCAPMVNTVWSLFKPFMKEKFKHRIKVLGSDMRDLHQFLDPCILPTRFGGPITADEDQEIAQWILDKEK